LYVDVNVNNRVLVSGSMYPATAIIAKYDVKMLNQSDRIFHASMKLFFSYDLLNDAVSISD
jgi:hypothetical protein